MKDGSDETLRIKVTERQLKVFNLRRQGLTFNDIAKRFRPNITKQAVQQSYQRAVEAIQNLPKRK